MITDLLGACSGGCNLTHPISVCIVTYILCLNTFYFVAHQILKLDKTRLCAYLPTIYSAEAATTEITYT